MEKMSESKLAEAVSYSLNGGFSTKKFCNAMEKEHRTLQQSFTELCYEWLKTCASDNYRYDGRNEASHLTAEYALIGLEQHGYLREYRIVPLI